MGGGFVEAMYPAIFTTEHFMTVQLGYING